MPRKNIKLGVKAFERHSKRREYYGLSWEDYLDAGCPTIPESESE